MLLPVRGNVSFGLLPPVRAGNGEWGMGNGEWGVDRQETWERLEIGVRRTGGFDGTLNRPNITSIASVRA